ncbi:MAG: hypothetical protein ABI620_08710 [Chloroflexota bacterium]
MASAQPSRPVPPAGWIETFALERGMLRDLVAGPSGLLAAGCVLDVEGTCSRAILLASPDGRSWAEIDLEGATGSHIQSIKRVGARLFALGYRADDVRFEIRATPWTSIDGRTWTLIESTTFENRSVTDIIDAPLGALAIGHRTPYGSESFGFATWQVGSDGSFGGLHVVSADSAFVNGVAWVGSRFIAWRPEYETGPNDEAFRSTVLMTSSDGKEWTDQPKVASFHGATVEAMIVFGDRLVAIGYEGATWPPTPRAWTSRDGKSWAAAEVPVALGALYTVGIEGSRLVARGREAVGSADQPLTWRSTDGTVWTRVGDHEDMPAIPGFSALNHVTIGPLACTAGTYWSDAGASAAIYCR